MAFKSRAQMGKFFAMEKEGKLKKGTAKKWLKHTKDVKSLPGKLREHPAHGRS